MKKLLLPFAILYMSSGVLFAQNTKQEPKSGTDDIQACCLPSGNCVMLEVTDCLAQGGIPMGPVQCSQIICPNALREYGDAPEASLAYPDNGVIGNFPTCKNVPTAGFIEHNNFGAWFGPNFDFEPDGNAGNCPIFNPNMYNMDECMNDGDAGLLFPAAFNITGPIGSEVYVPCVSGLITPLGNVCYPVVWGQNIDIHVHNTMPSQSTGYVNLLIDWNRNGQWAGIVTCSQPGSGTINVPEHVLVNIPVPNGYNGPLSALLGPFPYFLCGNVSGFVWARFSITEVPVALPWDGSGIFEDGETEDYLFKIDPAIPEDLDWGDAPDPTYQTLAVSNGARHHIIPGVHLGNLIDAENDGQPAYMAMGDDNNNLMDEDGVSQIWGYLSGSPSNLLVNASAAGFLDAWADYNVDGDWLDPGEQIFTSVPLIAGNNRLSFIIPTLAGQTETYFRYRYSQTGGLNFIGEANSGEVEDYGVIIACNPQYKWNQSPDPTLSGLHCHDAVVNQAYQQIYCTDDWLCNGGQVTQIIWYGCYENQGSGIEKFNLKILPDNPMTCLPMQLPLLDYSVDIANANEWPTGVSNIDGRMIYAYSYTLPAPFLQVTGARYWLAITSKSNDSLNPAIWRWQEASRSHVQALCPSATMTVINGQPSLWTPVQWADGTVSEMAFQIMNAPAPAVLPYNFLIQAGNYVKAETWHNWFGGEVFDTIPIRFFSFDSLDKINFVQFFYSSDNITWNLLGTDINDQESPMKNGSPDILTPGDGWAINVPVTTFQSLFSLPVSLYFKVELVLKDGSVMTYIKPEAVTFDPSPPSSFNVSIPDWYNTFRDSLDVSVLPLLANASSWYYIIDPKMPYFNKGVPNASQQNPSFPGGGIAYCAPTSTAACFKYFESNGDNTLCGGLSMNNLILQLAQKCKTRSDSGTYFGPWVKGIKDWIESHGDNYTVRTRSFWKKDANGNDIYTFNYLSWLLMRNELEHGQDILVDWAWFSGSTWLGSHAVTFNSILNKPLNNGKYRVDFMDPWTNNQQTGELDPSTGTVTAYGNSPGYSNLNAKITNIIIICPKEAASLPTSGGTSASGPNPPPAKIRILLPGQNFLRVYCLDQEGFQYRKDIVFERLLADFGDAPDSYKTLLNSNGPRHLLDNITYLGDTVDPDNDGMPTAAANGDDLNNIDDEDGVTISGSINQGDTATFIVKASSQGPYLQAWIDFNKNGVFDHPSENVIHDAIVVAGINIYKIPITANAVLGTTYARFRLCTQPDLIPYGPAPNGEVEDYMITIEEPTWDFGDAPDPSYPTLIANNGARHRVIQGIKMGNLIDSENDGLPSNLANGDDINNLDDEDGVIVKWGNIAGSPTNIVVNASAPGYLDAWADFNADGDWSDAGEKIFDSVTLIAGNNRLSYIVPPMNVVTATYFRYRYSQVGGLNYIGHASSGEVEDYTGTIGYDSTLKWAQYPDPELPGLHSHDGVVNQTYQQIYNADDWLCNGGQVTRIIWYGCYENPGSWVKHFNIKFISDNPQNCLPLQPPPTALLNINAGITSVSETPTGITNSDGYMIYSYTYDLPVPFQQESGTRYWLAITAVSNDSVVPSLWRWQEAARSHVPALCPSAEMTMINNQITGWTSNNFNGVYPEMAFQIINIPVPPVMPSDFFIVAGEWLNPETWHNWIGGSDSCQVTLVANDPQNRMETVTFFYSLDNITWTLIGTDTSGTDHFGGMQANADKGDGWSAFFIPSSIGSVVSSLFFKTEILVNTGDIIIYQKPEVSHFDPTPPGSFSVSIPDYQEIENDQLIFDINPDLANINLVEAKIELKPLDFNKGIPHLSQHNQIYPDSGSFYCGPVAVAACLKYYEPNYPAITGGLSNTALVQSLATQFGTDTDSGTYINKMARGVQKWITNHGGGFTVRLINRMYRDVYGQLKPRFNYWDWLKMRNELERCQDVIPLWYWRNPYGDLDGGHYATFNSVRNLIQNNPAGTYRVDFMDPWTGEEEAGNIYPGSGIITGYANGGPGYPGYSNLQQQIASMIIICPNELGPISGGGTVIPGPDPPQDTIQVLTPGYHNFRLICLDNDGFTARKDIIIRRLAIDYSDAPDSYSTLLASNGARHIIDPAIYMGDTIDWDADGMPTAGANGDDITNIDDEDGVTFTGSLTPDDSALIQVKASIQGAYLQAWIDYNKNGLFDHPAENVIHNSIVVAGINTYAIHLPESAVIGSTYARFRLCMQPDLMPYGSAPNGEVEDYKVSISEKCFDFGDAPDPTYPTLLASNGAHHDYNSNLYLGSLLDIEVNGQPNSDASGDDSNGADDEDGVVFLIPPAVGNPAVMEVTASSTFTGTMYLNAWIDYNGDGDWSDTGEHIFIDRILIPGAQKLAYIVPSTALPGNTFARFRLSSVPGLSFTGLAVDGEVEDYMIEIIKYANNIKWKQRFNGNHPGVHAHDYYLQQNYYVPAVADDWLCYGDTVNDIHWWGNYENDGSGNELRGSGINHFHLAIYNDMPDTSCGPVEPPLWSSDVTLANSYETATGIYNSENSMIYNYSYYLNTPFAQNAGNTYWLAISAISNDSTAPPRWRWQESFRTQLPILCGAEARTTMNGVPGSWSELTANNGSLYLNMAFEITTTPPLAILQGNAHYLNDLLTPMNDSRIFLCIDTAVIDSTDTDLLGNYSFTLASGHTYNLHGKSWKTWGGGNSTDALLTLKHFVQLSLLTGLNAYAADVDNSTHVNSIDALMIAKRFVGMLTSFPAGDWIFSNPYIDIPVPGIYNQDIEVLCFGDVNSSYEPPSVKTSSHIDIIPEYIIKPEDQFNIPLKTDVSLDIGAISLVTELPEGIIVDDVSPASGIGNLFFRQSGQELRISWYSLDPMAVKAGDIVLTIKARCNGNSEGFMTALPASVISDRHGNEFENVKLTAPVISNCSKPGGILLTHNIPNPFTGITDIWYTLPEDANVDLVIYNSTGELVNRLVTDETQQAGLHHVTFDCTACAPGTYIYKLTVKSASNVQIKRHNMILIR